METATNGFYDYFGLNVTYACQGIEETMDTVKAEWQSLIDPFCGESVPNTYVRSSLCSIFIKGVSSQNT